MERKRAVGEQMAKGASQLNGSMSQHGCRHDNGIEQSVRRSRVEAVAGADDGEERMNE
jgi:hypothetical protein